MRDPLPNTHHPYRLSLKPRSFFCMPGIPQVCCGVYNCASECMWAESVRVKVAGRWIESVWEADVGNCSCQNVSGQMESNLEQQLDAENFDLSHLSCTFLRDSIVTQTYFCRFWGQSAPFEPKEEGGIGVKMTASSCSQKYHWRRSTGRC